MLVVGFNSVGWCVSGQWLGSGVGGGCWSWVVDGRWWVGGGSRVVGWVVMDAGGARGRVVGGGWWAVYHGWSVVGGWVGLGWVGWCVRVGWCVSGEWLGRVGGRCLVVGGGWQAGRR